MQQIKLTNGTDITEINCDTAAFDFDPGTYGMTISRALVINRYYNMEQFSDEELQSMSFEVING